MIIRKGKFSVRGDMMGVDIKITENAAAEIKNTMKQKNKTGHAVRIGLVSNSCSTYSYNIDFEEIPDEQQDIVAETAGLKIFIAKKASAC